MEISLRVCFENFFIKWWDAGKFLSLLPSLSMLSCCGRPLTHWTLLQEAHGTFQTQKASRGPSACAAQSCLALGHSVKNEEKN